MAELYFVRTYSANVKMMYKYYSLKTQKEISQIPELKILLVP